jgi:hypothetical protein
MALEITRPPTVLEELSRDKGRSTRKPYNFTAVCEPIV